MSQLDDLKQFIKTQYPEGTQILGSQLGAIVKRDYSNLVTQAGNLSALIRASLSDLLVFSGKRGVDNTYRVINTATTSASIYYSPDDGELWNVYSNPRYPGEIFIRNADKVLVKFETSAPSIAHGFSEFPRLNDADIQKIISDFLVSNKPLFAPTTIPESKNGFDTPHYWKNWMQFLRSINNNAAIANWRSYHAQAVENAFVTKLNHFGFSPKEIEKWSWVLTSSRAKLPTESERKPSATHIHLGNAADKPLRELIHAAIDQLSDEQLKSVNLPAWTLINATRNY